MSYINWGSETPEQLALRRRLEEQAIYEQAARMARAKQRAGQTGGSSRPNQFIATFDWLSIAPGGSGAPEGASYEDFDSWESGPIATIEGVRRLVIRSESANAHVHSDNSHSLLKIDLYDSHTSSWITVWTKDLLNPNYPDGSSDDFYVNGIDTVFSAIAEVTKIRFTSDPGSDQTYHDWGYGPTYFDFYR